MKPAEMTALVNYGPGAGDTELRTVPVPELTDPYDVILRVEAVGICGSDVHQWLGRHSWNVNYPVILGHEFTGTIAELGAQVRAFAVGERVVSETAAVINHESAFAKQGLYHLDPERLGFGYGTDGAMAEFVRVPSRLLHRVSSDLPTDLAVLAEPCCVAYSAVVASGNVRPGQRVDVEHAAVAGARLARHLHGRVGRNRAFAEDGGDGMLAHGVDDLANLLRRALAVGVDRPQVKFVETEVARKIGKRALAGDEPAPFLRDGGQPLADRPGHGLDLGGIGLGVGGVGRRVVRVVLGKGGADVVDIDQHVGGRHPGMRVGLAGIGALADAHRLDALADDHAGDALEVAEEALEPLLEVQPVPQDQVGVLRLEHVAGRRLVVVDLGVGPGDRFHLGRLAGDVAGDVGDDGEGGDDLELLRLRGGGKGGETEDDGG